MSSSLRTGIAVACVLVFASCSEFHRQADANFGDQNFKSAIALIELHRLRTGSYPNALSDLKFLGAWDQNWIAGVEYRKLEEGYELNVTRGWIAAPDLEYGPAFWQGLGIRKTNVRRAD